MDQVADLARTLTDNGFEEVTARSKAKWMILFERKLQQLDPSLLLEAFESGVYDEAFKPIAEGLELIQALGPDIDRIVAEAKRIKSEQSLAATESP